MIPPMLISIEGQTSLIHMRVLHGRFLHTFQNLPKKPNVALLLCKDRTVNEHHDYA